MFNIGPMELLVLAVVGLILLGPEKLPGLARDAARMLHTLRELATNARTQLRDELGPEFADLDLRKLNPRTALQDVILGEDADTLRNLHPRNALQRAILGEDDRATLRDLDPRADIRDALSDHVTSPQPVTPPTPRRLGRGEAVPFDTDAT